MKKQGAIIISIMLILVFSLLTVKAIEAPSTPQDPSALVSEKTQGVITTENEVNISKFTPMKTNAEKRLEWLVSQLNKYVKPVSKYVIGTDLFEISFIMGLTVMLWIFFLSTYYTITGMTSFSKGVAFIMALMLTLVTANIGVIKKTADTIAKILTSWWTWLIVLIIIIALILVERFAAQFFAEQKEKRAKMLEELDRVKLHGETAAFEPATRSIGRL